MKRTLIAAAALVLIAITTQPASAEVYRSSQSCTGTLILSDEQNGDDYALKPDKGNTSLWCDAALTGKHIKKVLDVCDLGGRCKIAGSFAGHGNFGWTSISEVKILLGGDSSCAIVNSPDGLLAVRTGPGTNHPTMFQLHSKQQVWVDRNDGKWWHVSAIKNVDKEVDGWVYGDYLRPSKCPEGC
jgi:Bacterial SH3 domain